MSEIPGFLLISGLFLSFLASILVEIARKPGYSRMSYLLKGQFLIRSWKRDLRPEFVPYIKGLQITGFVLILVSGMCLIFQWASIVYAL